MLINYVLAIFVAQEQQHAPGAGLPDTLAELGNTYDPALRDRLVDEVEALGCATEDAYTADQRRGINPQVARYADIDAIVLGYSVSIALVGQEKWWDSHSWRLYADLIDTARDPEVDGSVEIYVPDDTQEKIVGRTNLTADDLDSFMHEFQGITTPYRVDMSHRQSLPGEARMTSSAAAVYAAGERCPPNTVFATYSEDARAVAETIPDIGAADPADIYAALDMNRGRYDLPAVNRIGTAVQWFGPRAEEAEQLVPAALQEAPPDSNFDVAVLDESAGVEVSLRRTRDDEHWTDTLAFLDTAVQQDDIDVYMPSSLAGDMKDNVGGDPGARVRDDIRSLTHSLQVGPVDQYDIPDRFEGMAGDYAIADAAARQGDSVLVATYDSDFTEIPGVTAVSPGTGAELLADS